jgi:hypothetical protein
MSAITRDSPVTGLEKVRVSVIVQFFCTSGWLNTSAMAGNPASLSTCPVLKLAGLPPGMVVAGVPSALVAVIETVAVTVDGGNVSGWGKVGPLGSFAEPPTHGRLAAYAGATTELISTGAAQAAPRVTVRRLMPSTSRDAQRSSRALQPFTMPPRSRKR